jgi:hypothetical protein
MSDEVTSTIRPVRYFITDPLTGESREVDKFPDPPERYVAASEAIITYDLTIGNASAKLITAQPICIDCLKVLLEGQCLVDQFCHHQVWPGHRGSQTPPVHPDLPPHSDF